MVRRDDDGCTKSRLFPKPHLTILVLHLRTRKAFQNSIPFVLSCSTDPVIGLSGDSHHNLPSHRVIDVIGNVLVFADFVCSLWPADSTHGPYIKGCASRCASRWVSHCATVLGTITAATSRLMARFKLQHSTLGWMQNGDAVLLFHFQGQYCLWEYFKVQ